MVELLAQVGDVDLHDVGLAVESRVPHRIQDLRLGDHPPRVRGEEHEEVELGGGQGDRLAGTPDLVSVEVHHQVVEADPAQFVWRHAAAEYGPDPGDQLLDAERLGDVVVTQGETGQLVGTFVTSREEEHRGCLLYTSDAADEEDSVDLGGRRI